MAFVCSVPERRLNLGAGGLEMGIGISEPQSWTEAGTGDQVPQHLMQLLAASRGHWPSSAPG